MAIDLPIKLDFSRPLSPPDSPYLRCGSCEYVAIPTAAKPNCPGCGGPPGNAHWPDVEMMELWNDAVFAWNYEKAELATVIAAMQFEASTFFLLYWATVWLDPDLNWIGADFEELRDKNERIHAYLDTITTFDKTNDALTRVFGVGGKQMLRTVLGPDADPLWANYTTCRHWRNKIAHCGKRIYYETIPANMRATQATARDQVLRASLRFVPECWVVFSKLWNEYIHKPMWAKVQAGHV